MPSKTDHALVGVVRDALWERGVSDAYLSLLEARLAALAAITSRSSTAAAPADNLELPGALRPSALARDVLESLGTEWDDGDEAFVRERLDSWRRGEPGDDAPTRLLKAADALADAHVRPETLIFFLWELESVLEGLPADGHGLC